MESELDFEAAIRLPPLDHPELWDTPRHSRKQLPPASREAMINQKRTYAELLTSEIRYRRLFEAARDGILILDPDSRKITEANPFMVELLGYSRDEMIGKELWEIGLLKDERTSQTAFKALQRDYYVRYDDLPLQSKGGQSHEVEVVGNLYEEAGQWVVQCNIRDITERKVSERTIAGQSTLLDQARDAILVRDLEGSILFWNKGAERLYGFPGSEVLGKNARDLYYAEKAAFDTANSLTISKGEWSGEFTHLTKDRREIVVQARWTLIRDTDGKPKSVFAINTDVTERKKIEAQFMRAQRMECIGSLAGGIAHDLNNILTPIMVSIDVLKEKLHDDRVKRILQTIEVSARRGSDIVRQILSFAKGPEDAHLEVQPKHLLMELRSFIKDTFPRNIQLRFLVANDTWTILGDLTQLHQILLNLSLNARDAMPNGGLLTISLENCTLLENFIALKVHAKPGRYVKISVSDTGTGISGDLIPKIFEPFFTTKEADKGTGLGLSTVKGIMETHQGLLDVQSEIGHGSTFIMYLPAVEIASSVKETTTIDIKPLRGNGESILVVDDEASILAITRETLETFGYRVLTASNGAEAVSLYAAHRNEVALVLTDMMMPGTDGPTTIQGLVAINPSVKIIGSSGFSLESGLEHFLPKPYSAGTLLDKIAMVLSSRMPR
jgi:PAS domain S-box-containing protein